MSMENNIRGKIERMEKTDGAGEDARLWRLAYDALGRFQDSGELPDRDSDPEVYARFRELVVTLERMDATVPDSPEHESPDARELPAD